MQQEIRLAEAVPENLEDIIKIEDSSFESDRFNRRQFNYLLGSRNSKVVIAYLNESPAGYLILLKRKKSRKLRIYSIAVHPDKRGMGISQKLMDFTYTTAEKEDFKFITLEVKENNAAAINLYTKNGFKVTGFKDNYYENGSRAVLMRKEV